MRLCVPAVLALAMAASSFAADPPEIKLEGSGEARAAQDAMSFKPFDTALLSGLTDWTGGPALTAEAIKGKPVMFVTWASWYKTSHEALRLAQSIHARFADKGLIVVGVHHREGWSKAAEVIKAQAVEFPVALDKDGNFRKTLRSEQDPDFFFIDRAGRLRFADVQTPSAEAAAELLTGETAEQAAAATPPAPAKAAENAGADSPPVGKFTPPPPEAYKAAKWPKTNAQVAYARNVQGKPLPKPLGKEKYLDGKTPDRAGKVTVVDFWATWCHPCREAMPKLDALYKANKDDLVIIGISDEPEATLKPFLAKNPHSYPQAYDTASTSKNGLGIQGIPHVVVMSSDGVVRWQGNPHDPNFEQTVKAVMAADPGVKARHEAK